MQNSDVQLCFEAFNGFLTDTRSLPVLNAHRQPDDSVVLEEKVMGKTKRFADIFKNIFGWPNETIFEL